MRSMTGFGQAIGEESGVRVTVTAKSVNHRYLDLSLRLRDDRPTIERKVREIVSERVQRGRLDLVLEVEKGGGGSPRAQVDEELLDSIQTLVSDLAGRGLVSREIVLGDLLRIPELVRYERDGSGNDDETLLLSTVAQAIDSLIAARYEEGEKLRVVLTDRITKLEALVREMGKLTAGSPKRQADALRERLGQLLSGVEGEAVDEQRLAQEVAILADRVDIAEELERLDAHLDYFRSVCGDKGGVGKKLDFLAQEIFRELNTIGSKCRDSHLKRHVVEGKVLCEQLREQIQNIE